MRIGHLVAVLLVFSPGALVSAARAAEPSPTLPAERAPLVSGQAFDAYLDARIAIRRGAPDLDAELDQRDDLTGLGSRLAPWLTGVGLTEDAFAQAHRVVGRDPGLRDRVRSILDRHDSRSGAAGDAEKTPPGGGALMPVPSESSDPSRPSEPARP